MTLDNMSALSKSIHGGCANLLQNEVIGISGWRGQHDDDRNKPMLEQSHERGIEGFVASPKT
jgi:hypothetical protein